MLWIQIILFAVLAWCGLYLLSRDIRNPRLWGAGIGTSLTAIGLGTGMLIPFATPLQIGLHIVGTGLLILSVTLLRQESRKRGEAWLPDVMRAFDYSFFF
ncbi:hypothetical protein [Paenibacillus sp. 1P07SE]|uniref:hypothetical protein n=1 Tax=Paenibacillus sp. 1P07SE TaxID=3132209 RepID=UPI0039A4EBA4